MPNSNIFIPKRLKVGFQNRADTYTGKLSYVIYYDEKGALRKEKSWENWRSKEIEPIEIDNEPIEGFVLNKKVGGYKSDWNYRQSYIRVYDPRGFEFEITVPNLLYVLENANCIKGKGLEGEFVYGWDGTDLLLVPVNSPDYECIKELSIKKENPTIKAKDLKVGTVYLSKDNATFVYMGRFDYYDEGYILGGKEFTGLKTMINYALKNGISYQERVQSQRWPYRETIKSLYDIDTICFGKRHYFAHISDEGFESFCAPRSLSGWLIEIVQEQYPDYDLLFEKMEGYKYYSPIDETKTKFVDYSLSEFVEKLSNRQREQYFVSGISDQQIGIWIKPCDDKYIKHETRDIFESWLHFAKRDERELYTPEQLFDMYHFVHVDKYLRNGRFYSRSY